MGAKRREFSPGEIDQALIVLAYHGGNSLRAADECGIPASTLRQWRNELHRDRYLELVEREAPKIEALAAQQAREAMIRAGQTEARVYDLIDERIDDAQRAEPEADDFTSEALYEAAYKAWLDRGNTKTLSELAGTAQRIATAKGINGTKVLELTGRPTTIIGYEDPIEAGKRLMSKYGIAVESTAEDITARALTSAKVSANARETQSQNPPD
jgi:transposase-like protein